MQILILDDNENISTLLYDIITLEGHEGVIAHDGASAKSFIESQQFDLAFCDLTLPDISGWEVVSYLRETAPATKIIIISGMGNTIDQSKQDKYQIERVVNKPFQVTQIQSVLEDLC